jgi:hypothetical protein
MSKKRSKRDTNAFKTKQRRKRYGEAIKKKMEDYDPDVEVAYKKFIEEHGQDKTQEDED